MHDPLIRSRAVAFVRSGVTNADVARLLDVPPGTVSYWTHIDRTASGTAPGIRPRPCPRCDGCDLDEAAYSYLLGLYLGDGYIVQHAQHRAPVLAIACGNAWPGLMDACEAAMRSVFPGNSVHRRRKTGCADVKLSSKHLTCLFPQHGPGRKHERPIALEPWQQRIVRAHPWEFVRGLIHSDGSRVINWTTRTIAGQPKRYEYPRYFFTNTSDDIIRLYTDTLDSLGVAWKHLRQRRRAQTISVARRASVALMDAHVGPKF
ncbi:helix-turn-helix domain-containing protein [Streptomyces carpaticus]|uniref:helix-turn-helix domain-containing protein n=1 Tax=Streptomyces carpaticus TaxID=285558 RepID=UPI0031F7A4E8